jgi:hypothetical protein
MDCYDCAGLDRVSSAVAVCIDCGAGLCQQHAYTTARWLVRMLPISRPVPSGPPARMIRCAVCQAAREAVPDATSATDGAG